MIETLVDKAKARPEFLEELRELSKKSLYFFIRGVLNFNKLTPSLHLPLCEFIQDLSILRKLILMPRGHYKTTCGSIGFILWLIIQDLIPGLGIPGCEARILLAKENATLAEHDLNAIEETCDNNQLLQLLFPKLVPDKSKRKRWNAQELLVNRESSWPEATVETIGVGGAKQGTHYDIIIYDDIIGDKAKDSETVMDATTEWFVYSESLFISLHKGISNVLGTRWSKRDVYQHILDKDKRFRPYTRQAIEDGVPIFPEQFPLDTLLDIMNRNVAHWSCLPETERILTSSGLKRISSVSSEDLVYSHKGEVKKVLSNHKEVAKSLLKISLYNKHKPLLITSNHKLPCFRSFKYKATNIAPYHLGKISEFVDRKIPGSYDWCEAGFLKKHDLLMLPINYMVDNNLPLCEDKDFWWFVGLWLGDGWTDGSNRRIVLSLSSTEIVLKLENYLMSCWATPLCIYPAEGCVKAAFNNDLIFEFIQQFGKDCYTKNIPEKFINLPPDCQRGLWRGLLDSDGYETEDILGVNSVALDLLLFYQRMLLRLGVVASCTLVLKGEERKAKFRDKEYNTKPLWNLRVYKHSNKHHRSFIYGGKLFSRIAKIEKLEGEVEVFDLTVEDHHSFCTEVAAVGNSQYCNNPADPTKCDFKEQWLKYYEFERRGERLFIKFQDDEKLVPWTEIDLVGSFDPSIDEKPTASRRAVAYVGMDSKERVLLIDEYASREALEKVLDVIYMTHGKWSPRVFGVEKAALQKVFIWIIERENRLRKKYISCMPVNVSTAKSKEARIRDTIQPIASEGRFYLRKQHFEFLQEYIDFPQGRTKDLLDAVSNGIKLLRLPMSEQEEAEEAEEEEKLIEQRSNVTGY